MEKRVTIKDIARISGCSVNCVSRALMDAPDISLATRQKIREIADSMGYIPNNSAAALRGGKAKAIAVLFDSLLNPFYYIMTNYIWSLLHEEDYNILTFKNDTFEFDEDMAKRIVASNIDGVLSFLTPTKQAYALLEANSVPIVVIGRKTHGLCDSIVIDDESGGRLAAENFISRGFKKPAYFAENRNLDCVVERGDGFIKTFKKAGITAEIKYLEDLENRNWEKYIDGIIGNNAVPDCIFCYNDQLAYEIMTELDKKAVNVAVIGFDNIQKEIFMPGMLTTIDYDKRGMARLAVDIIMNKINGITDNHEQETQIKNLSVSFSNPFKKATA